jgi:plasmid stabilization system protein ParE
VSSEQLDLTSLSKLETDVLVCGGGCAGLTAALAAARNGANVLLVERAGFAGGIITTVGLPYFDGIADLRTNRIVVRGIPLELLSKSGICEANATRLRTYNPTIDNIERFKILADRLMAEQPALRVLYHSVVCEALVQGDEIREVLVANKAGLSRVRARVVVDCTGDADVAWRAGAPVEKAATLQPMTMHFRIGNVRRTETMRVDCRQALIRAQERGELPMFYGPGVEFLFAPDEVYIHAIRVPADGSDPEDLTRAEIQGRRDAWTMFEAWKREVPGFEDAYFISSGPYIGVRETRRIVGQYVLTEDDILATRRFDDAIATGCWDLDQHPNQATPGSALGRERIIPHPYDIPYRTLLPRNIANLLVAGRCHSATQLAASSTRVNATAMALGEAAGTAAALANMHKVSPQELAGAAVRDALIRQGGGPVQG